MSMDGSESKIRYEIFKKYLSQEIENTELLHRGKTIIVGNPVLYIVHKKGQKQRTEITKQVYIPAGWRQSCCPNQLAYYKHGHSTELGTAKEQMQSVDRVGLEYVDFGLPVLRSNLFGHDASSKIYILIN